MKKIINKIISCLLAAVTIVSITSGTANAWTTEIYFATPTGHEVLTKDAAYLCGSYYKDDFDRFISAIKDNVFGQQTHNYTQKKLIEAGWGKNLLKKVKVSREARWL